MNADQAQAPLSLPAFLLLLGVALAVCAFLLLLGVALAVCAVRLLVEWRQTRRDQRGEYVPPRMPRGRL